VEGDIRRAVDVGREIGLPELLGDELRAPSLMWSESQSALHERVGRGELAAETADVARTRHVALAALLRCRLITVDGRLRRGANRLGFVVGPTEL
jgi:hypothetical protein